jgi:uncharacterized membrane protein
MIGEFQGVAMKTAFQFKPTSKQLTFVLLFLALLLIAMGIAGALGFDLPKGMASLVSDIAIFGALGVFLYNRKLRADAAKAKADEIKVEATKAEAASESAETS